MLLLSQEYLMTMWCPMRFKKFPLDDQVHMFAVRTLWSLFLTNKVALQVCQFQVGSYAYDDKKMTFKADRLLYNKSKQTTVLDYNVDISPLKPKDTFYVWQDIGNYSLTGFEVRLSRNSGKYLVNYYLNSGLFVVVSWVWKNSEFLLLKKWNIHSINTSF